MLTALKTKLFLCAKQKQKTEASIIIYCTFPWNIFPINCLLSLQNQCSQSQYSNTHISQTRVEKIYDSHVPFKSLCGVTFQK